MNWLPKWAMDAMVGKLIDDNVKTRKWLAELELMDKLPEVCRWPPEGSLTCSTVSCTYSSSSSSTSRRPSRKAEPVTPSKKRKP